MLRKVLLILCIVVTIMARGPETDAWADGGKEFFGHTVQRYDNAVQAYATDETQFLTKDSVERVRQFFEQTRQNGDRVEPVVLKSKSAYRLVYAGPELQRPVQLVSFEEKDNDANIHPALGELKAQVVMGRHSEGEYLALEKQYKRLHLAYFKEVDDGQGGTVPEGRKIYNATYAQVHGATKAAMQSQRPTQSRRAEAAELRRQMQDMKARGDIAGMMQKAKEFRSSPDQAMPGATAMRSMNEDTWDIWVRCLRDIDAVAYRTRIQYFPAAWR